MVSLVFQYSKVEFCVGCLVGVCSDQIDRSVCCFSSSLEFPSSSTSLFGGYSVSQSKKREENLVILDVSRSNLMVHFYSTDRDG